MDVDPATTPKFFKACQIPLHPLPKVGETINNLVEKGIFELVHRSWATPVVTILKKNGSIHLY